MNFTLRALRSSIFFLTASILVSSAHADSLYKFGGTCGSQGAYTAAAMAHIDNLLTTLKNLRDNPACKDTGLASLVASVEKQRESVKANSGATGSGWQTLPKEISVLLNAFSSKSKSGDIGQTLMSKINEAGILTAQDSVFSSAQSTGNNTDLTATQGLVALATRTGRATTAGLSVLQELNNVLPQLSECLDSDSDTMGSILASAVYVAGTFASGDIGMANAVASSIATLTSTIRNHKYGDSMIGLMEAQYEASISCLLEATTENYCAVEDAGELLKSGLKQLSPAIGADSKLYFQHPLAGYYVLTRDVPAISVWLNQILTGTKPKNTAESGRRNSLQSEISEHRALVMTLRAVYEEQLQKFKDIDPSAVDAKKNFILSLISGVSQKLGKEGGEFFDLATDMSLLEYYLIDMKFPERCFNKQTGTRLSFSNCVRGNGTFVEAAFDSPDDLMATFGVQLEKLISLSDLHANDFFRQWLVVDIPNLVASAESSALLPISQALENLNQYLDAAAERFQRYGNGGVVLPFIYETKDRIEEVKAAFDALDAAQSQVAPKTKEERKAYIEKYQALFQKVVDKTIDNFEIVSQEKSYLSVRLATIVEHDYKLRLKADQNMSAYERELLLSAKDSLMDMVVKVHGKNPSELSLDLAQAQRLNQQALDSIEITFKNSLYPLIQNLKLGAEGKARGLWRTRLENFSRAMQPKDIGRSFKENPIATSLAALFSPSLIAPVRMMMNSDLYPIYMTRKYDIASNDSSGVNAYQKLRAKLCIHTLAFQDAALFKDVCEGAILQSPYDEAIDTVSDLSMSYDDMYPLAVKGFMQKMKAKGNSAVLEQNKADKRDAICAYSSYSQNTLLYYMSQETKKAVAQ